MRFLNEEMIMQTIFFRILIITLISLTSYAADIVCRCNPIKINDQLSSCSCPSQGSLKGTTLSVPAGEPRFLVPAGFLTHSEVVWIICESSLDPDNNHPTTYKTFRVTNFQWAFEKNPGVPGCGQPVCHLTSGGNAEKFSHSSALGARATCTNTNDEKDWVRVSQVSCLFYK
jgi:hypothetical protein